jgi:hypothetical protein
MQRAIGTTVRTSNGLIIDRLSRGLLLALASCLVWFGPVVCAQDQHTQELDRPALSGPEVEDRAVPGMEKTFGAAMMNTPMVVRESIPMNRFMELARAMEGDQALSQRQQRAAQEVVTAWNQQVAAYYGQYLAEFEAARELLPENEARSVAGLIRSGTRANEQGWKVEEPDAQMAAMAREADDAMMAMGMESMMQGSMNSTEDDDSLVLLDAADARALVARIRRGAPSAWEPQTKIWNLLNRSQQETMGESIRVYREQERERRELREMRRVADREGAEVSMTLTERTRVLELASQTGELSEEQMARMPEALRERFESLEGEDRHEAVRTLAKRLLAQRDPSETPARPVKAPPSLAELAIPDPE